jgi:hypothetical protein
MQMENIDGVPTEVEIARREMHVTIDNLDAAKLAYKAGTGSLADINAATDSTHEATDRYFDAMRRQRTE